MGDLWFRDLNFQDLLQFLSVHALNLLVSTPVQSWMFPFFKMCNGMQFYENASLFSVLNTSVLSMIF